MCGRFTVTQTNPDAIQQSFDLSEKPSGDDMPPRYNVAPGQNILVVANSGSERKAGFMRWGLIPSWSKDRKIGYKLINARGESVHEKPSFRSAFKSRRCLIVADGFYEWHKNDDGSRTPMYITLQDGALFGMAGLWENWTDRETGEALTTCTIITTTPNELMATIHNRMPVILPRAAYDTWLGEDIDPLRDLLVPYDAAQMTAYPVSTLVNKPANDSPELIQRVS